MITRIEIDGFKSFQDFSVDLAPFQVIIGPNGCGKSNLFDAIQLLANLASRDLNSALRDLRGEAFTIKSEGQMAARMTLKIELLVDPTVTDEWGQTVELKHRRLRYIVEIERRKNDLGGWQPYVHSELLEPLSADGDGWMERYAGSSYLKQLNHVERSSVLYINTVPNDKSGASHTIFLMPEATYQSGGKTERFVSGKIERTLLSRVDTCEFPHVLAVRQEMRRWRNLHLSPDGLRLPSMLFDNAPGMVGGNYLPHQLALLKEQNKYLLRDVSRDLTNLVHGVTQVDVRFDEGRKEWNVFVEMRDGCRFPLPNLSDGTLRLLALATQRHDSRHGGVICVEEPEIGLHPGAFTKLVHVLRDTATGFGDDEQPEAPLRQMLATTHSPELVSHLDLRKGELLYADMATRVIPRLESFQVTLMMPVRPDAGERSPENAYSLNRVLEYLNGASVQTARNDVRKAILRR